MKESTEAIVVVSASDSITDATFSSDYLSILRRRLRGQHYEFVNAGRLGDTSENLLIRIDKDVLARNPDSITILIGANDATKNGPPAVSVG
jgi:acyl-CoA thioesterase I